MVTTRRSEYQRAGLLNGAEADGDDSYFSGSDSGRPARVCDNGLKKTPLLSNGFHSESEIEHQVRERSGEEGSDDDAPDVEVTAEARIREEERVAVHDALRAERKETRRKRSKARESAAVARKEKNAKRKKLRRKREEKASKYVLPQDVLERAAKAAEQQEVDMKLAAHSESVKSQEGVMRVMKQQRNVEGLEVVDASLHAKKREGASSAGKRALQFMNSCLYGHGRRRISSARGTATFSAPRERNAHRAGGRKTSEKAKPVIQKRRKSTSRSKA